MQVQLQDSSGGVIADGANVLFDTPLKSRQRDITYNATAYLRSASPANYFVSWWVNTDCGG